MSTNNPSSEDLIALPVDALGIWLLRELTRHPQSIHRANLYYSNTTMRLSINPTNQSIWNALAEAFDWLVANGLLAHMPGSRNEGFAFITRRGNQILAESEPLAVINATNRLSIDLHPRIESRVRSQFLLGEYEAAVLIAFREVEIRVRDLGGYDNSEIGTKLMIKAFNRTKNGPLVDPALDPGEQESMMHLFAGAIGAFKNPSSHRQVDYGDATVAAEAILFADLLLRILDRDNSASTARPCDQD